MHYKGSKCPRADAGLHYSAIQQALNFLSAELQVSWRHIVRIGGEWSPICKLNVEWLAIVAAHFCLRVGEAVIQFNSGFVDFPQILFYPSPYFNPL